MRTRYSTLWGYGDKRATENYSPFKSDEEARKFRDMVYKELKRRGVKAKRSTLNGQLRQYWSLGVPCGRSCSVYEIEYEDK